MESVRFGMVLALLCILMGVYLGLRFGNDEDNIKKHMKAQATSSAFYKGDDKLIELGVKKGWRYLKRSHEHFQGLGAISVGLILFLAAVPLKPLLRTVISIGIGLGAFVYPLFWYLIAYRIPEVGKHAAKESLVLMAQFGAGLFAVSFLAVILIALSYAVWKDNPPAFLERLIK
ncbi:MAG: hypothetical protein IEMM0002_0310 [bacterium]|nr:MAG: hypothetical protein IEMM0002_0310 [bacterium]